LGPIGNVDQGKEEGVAVIRWQFSDSALEDGKAKNRGFVYEYMQLPSIHSPYSITRPVPS
jgi:hypothetical protein